MAVHRSGRSHSRSRQRAVLIPPQGTLAAFLQLTPAQWTDFERRRATRWALEDAEDKRLAVDRLMKREKLENGVSADRRLSTEPELRDAWCQAHRELGRAVAAVLRRLADECPGADPVVALARAEATGRLPQWISTRLLNARGTNDTAALRRMLRRGRHRIVRAGTRGFAKIPVADRALEAALREAVSSGQFRTWGEVQASLERRDLLRPMSRAGFLKLRRRLGFSQSRPHPDAPAS